MSGGEGPLGATFNRDSPPPSSAHFPRLKEGARLFLFKFILLLSGKGGDIGYGFRTLESICGRDPGRFQEINFDLTFVACMNRIGILRMVFFAGPSSSRLTPLLLG